MFVLQLTDTLGFLNNECKDADIVFNTMDEVSEVVSLINCSQPGIIAIETTCKGICSVFAYQQKLKCI